LPFVWQRLTGLKIVGIFEITLKGSTVVVDKLEDRRGPLDQLDDWTAKEIVEFILKLGDPQPERPLVIDLKHPRRWMSSRLFFLVALVERYTKIPYLVFTDRATRDTWFIGMASPRATYHKLAQRYPYLEKQFLHRVRMLWPILL